MTHDDLHQFHHEILPLMIPSAPLAVLENSGTLGMSIPSSRFEDLVAVINVNQYNRDSQNLIRSVLACVIDISLVPHGNLTACIVQVHLHCDTEPRR